ncbi:HFR067Cp [Eremothecium sinecaudum]|uniref:HFR067Cp n=1 Tax=Eremothecium sinecaudum TaxID=45286 RepID=A0A0X8HUT7_9SACH|nr:HFR067Cp [Eremothecium sinecaudum]AMD21922.1 HFR067Cp [Eremothecium sinecaudum]
MSNVLQDIKEEEVAEYVQGMSEGVEQKKRSPAAIGGTSQPLTSTFGGSLVHGTGLQEQEERLPVEEMSDGQHELDLDLKLEKVVSQDSVKRHADVLLSQPLSEEESSVIHRSGEEVLLPPLPDINANVGSVFVPEAEEPEENIEELHQGLGLGSTTGGLLRINTDTLIDGTHLVEPMPLHSRAFADSEPPSMIAAESLAADPDTSFDLSKALEIPNHDHNNGNVSTVLPNGELENSSNLGSSHPISPLVSVPMTTLKRKISFTFNSNSNSGGENATLSPPLTHSQPQPQDTQLPQRSSKSISSNSRSDSFSGGRTSRSSSNAAHTVLLPSYNATLDKSAEPHHFSISQELPRSPARKISNGSHNSALSVLNGNINGNGNINHNNNSSGNSSGSHSSSSSGNVLGNNSHNSMGTFTSAGVTTSAEESFFKPHCWLFTNKRSKIGISGNYHGDLSNDFSTVMSSSLSNKKTPLLARASSVILRKTSFVKENNTNPSSASSPPPLGRLNDFRSLSEYTASDKLPRKSPLARSKLSRKSSLSPHPAITPFESTDLTSVSTRTSSAGSLLSPVSSFTAPSFGSKVRRGFSRIISGGYSKRVPSRRTASEVKQTTQYPFLEACADNNDQNSFENGNSNGSPNSQGHEHRLSIDSTSISQTSLYRTKSDRFVGGNGNSNKGQPFIPKRQNTQATLGSVLSPTQYRQRSYSSIKNSMQSTSSDDIQITVDVEEIMNRLPTITITEDFGAKNTTPVQTQSNIWCDRAYEARGESANTTEKMSLQEYVAILINQQMIEDERFSLLEKSFAKGGWCSRDDLLNLRRKRVLINKKWAERISYYQGKMEAS